MCSYLIIIHCSLRGNGLTATGGMALAKAIQQNMSLKELKWVVNLVSYYPKMWWLNNVVRCYIATSNHYIPTCFCDISSGIKYYVPFSSVFVFLLDVLFLQSWLGWLQVDWYWRWGNHCTVWSESDQALQNIGVSNYWAPHDHAIVIVCTMLQSKRAKVLNCFKFYSTTSVFRLHSKMI